MAPFDYGPGRWKNASTAAQTCLSCDVRSLTLCHGVPDDGIRRLQAATQAVSLIAGQPVVREGEPADHIFNVTSGTVKLYKLMADGRRQVTGFLQDGSFLGLSHANAYVYTAEAVTQVMLCRFQRKALEALMDEFPTVRKKFLEIVMDELAAVEDQKLLLGRKTALEKVASFLIMLSDRAVLRGHPQHLLSVPMGRLDIGDYLGLTIETVSRTLTQIKRAGAISIPDNSHIRIDDRAYLERISEGG
jgi:CRP/FNR family transcriptional regulator